MDNPNYKYLIGLAGKPATTVNGATGLVAKTPAPTKECLPIEIHFPEIIRAPYPIKTHSSTLVYAPTTRFSAIKQLLAIFEL